MQNYIVDINADVGEGIGNESLIMPCISSCNIACGGHAGNLKTMQTVVKLAKQHQVKIGAHPSFPDKENFGRVEVKMSSLELFKSLKSQIKALLDVVKEEHVRLHHVKPHGVLYNLAVKDERIATVIVEVIKSLAIPVKLYAPYKSVIADIAKENNIPVVFEAFADRNYNSDLTLVSRTQNNALIKDADVMFFHVLKMIISQKVKTIDRVEAEIKAQTYCVHGDNPEAVNLIKNLHERLKANGIEVQ